MTPAEARANQQAYTRLVAHADRLSRWLLLPLVACQRQDALVEFAKTTTELQRLRALPWAEFEPEVRAVMGRMGAK